MDLACTPLTYNLQQRSNHAFSKHQDTRAAKDHSIAQILLHPFLHFGVFRSGLKPEGGNSESLRFLEYAKANLSERDVESIGLGACNEGRKEGLGRGLGTFGGVMTLIEVVLG